MHTPANFASTTLSGSHNNSTTTLTFPSGGLAALKGASSYPFYAVIHNADFSTKEIVEVTATPGTDQATVVRGRDGTTGQTWSGGETVEQNPVAAHITELQGKFPVAVTDGGTGLTSLTTGDLPYATAANTLGKLGIGSTGQKLGISGGVPVWERNPIGVIFGGTSSSSSAYLSFNGAGVASTSTDPTAATTSSGMSRTFIAPCACTLYNFTVQISESGTACNVTLFVRVNGVDSGVSVTVTNTAGGGTDSVNTLSLSLRDRVGIHIVVNSGSFNGGAVTCTAQLGLP